jgi:hypothetical protein
VKIINKYRGQVVNYRRSGAEQLNWSEMILSEDGKIYFIRDYHTTFSKEVKVQFISIIGTIVEFEANGDLVTRVLTIQNPKKVCDICTSIVKKYENEKSFDDAKTFLVEKIISGNFLIKTTLDSFDNIFNESEYIENRNFKIPSTYYDFQFFSFFCKSCNAIFMLDDIERSSLSGSISYRKFPFSIFIPIP